MKAFIFLPLLLWAVFSVSPALTWETSISKQKEDSDPALVLEVKNEANLQGGQKESNKQEAIDTEERTESILQGRPGSSHLPGKPWNVNQEGRLQQGKPRSFYNQKERKTTGNPPKGNVIEIQNDKTNDKKPTGNTKCLSIYKPVCGSDEKTYGNRCLFNEAKRLSRGKLNIKHEGVC